MSVHFLSTAVYERRRWPKNFSQATKLEGLGFFHHGLCEMNSLQTVDNFGFKNSIKDQQLTFQICIRRLPIWQ